MRTIPERPLSLRPVVLNCVPVGLAAPELVTCVVDDLMVRAHAAREYPSTSKYANGGELLSTAY